MNSLINKYDSLARDLLAKTRDLNHEMHSLKNDDPERYKLQKEIEFMYGQVQAFITARDDIAELLNTKWQNQATVVRT